MARPHRPQWHAHSRRWRSKIDGVVVYFPREIGREDRPLRDKIPVAAWEYLDSLLRRTRDTPPPAADPTVYWLALAYLRWAEGLVDAGSLARAHWKNQRSHLRLLWSWGAMRDTRASRVSVESLDAFFEGLRERVSQHYLAGVGATIRAVWRWGARPIPGRDPVRILTTNPLEGYAFPRPPGAVREHVEGRIVRRFLRWAWARARAQPKSNLARRFDRLYLLLLQFQRLTGCRPGEACRLRWTDWDRKAGKIVFARHKTSRAVGRPRVIWVTHPARRLLERIERLEGRHPEFVFTHRRGRGSPSRGSLDPVAGEPWPSGAAAAARLRKLRAAAIDAGLEGIAATGPRRLVAYVARHAYASYAISHGLSIEQAAELLGNSPEVLSRIYAHTIDHEARARADRLAQRRPDPR